MPKHPVVRKGQASKSVKERRLPQQTSMTRRVFRLINGLLRRPLGFMRRDGRLSFGFLERRRAPPDALEAGELRADLRSRMLAYPPDHAAHMLRHLVQVHDELGRGGWAAVAALPAPVLEKALFQAQALMRDGSTPPLKKVIGKLRDLQPARPIAAEPLPRQRVQPAGSELEISEASQEDFDATERSWFGTLPPPADAPPAEEVQR